MKTKVILLAVGLFILSSQLVYADGVITQNLSLGSKGSQVIILQNYLIKIGILKASATGYFGPATSAAVKQVQKQNKLVADGKVGKTTMGIINASISSTKQINTTVSQPAPKTSSVVTNTITSENLSPAVGPSLAMTVDLNKRGSYSVTPNTPIILSWNYSNATSCVAKEDWSGSLETTGSKTITNLKSRNIFVIECRDSSNNISATNDVNVYVESIPPTQSESSLKIKKSLSHLIVFANSGESVSDTVKNDLCNSSGSNKFSYLPTWFKKEASRYGVLLSMITECYTQQVTLPQDVISSPDSYNAFGQTLPLPLNMAKTASYLAKNISSISNYDIVTVVYYRTSGDTPADVASIGQKTNFLFLTKGSVVDGVQLYIPDISTRITDGSSIIKHIAHESLHSLGALDHYPYDNPGECSTETDQNLRYTSPQVMCAALDNIGSAVIPQVTAREIGWIK